MPDFVGVFSDVAIIAFAICSTVIDLYFAGVTPRHIGTLRRMQPFCRPLNPLPLAGFAPPSMIRLSQLTLIRGTKVLLEAADVVLNPGDKIGLIGANGTGKSSLFALLRGELHQDQGEFDYPARWRVAHVAQETPALDRPALEYAIDGDTTLRRLETELAAAEAADDGMLMGELYAALGDADAYTVRSRAEQLLHGLGFSHEQMSEPVASFSGGWRMRLNLAQALMCPSDLLLLDEPTNHLDLDAIIWVEEWLKRYAGTLVIVSHDREVEVILRREPERRRLADARDLDGVLVREPVGRVLGGRVRDPREQLGTRRLGRRELRLELLQLDLHLLELLQLLGRRLALQLALRAQRLDARLHVEHEGVAQLLDAFVDSLG